MGQHEWMTEEYRAAGRYLAALIGSALNDRKAPEKPEDISWEMVYGLAARNSVEGMSCFGVDTLDSRPPAELYRRWKEAVNLTLYRQLHFDEERSQILKEMHTRGLSYLPLKGIHLAGYYPKPGMRSMADNDILYGYVEESAEGGYQIRGKNEEERAETVREAQRVMVSIMEARGYEVKTLTGNHDSYLKKPFYNFEMHRSLASASTPHYFYYKNPWKRAVRDLSDPYLYSFSDEDEYLFFLVHAFKHFDGSGCGIRNLADLYVFLKVKGDRMDLSYIRAELETLKLTEFVEKMRSLGLAVFEEERELTTEEEELLYYLLGCGTYGTMQAGIERKIEKLEEAGITNVRQAKLAYFRQRFFVTDDMCREHYPFFYRHRYLRPFLMPYRVIKGLVIHPGKLWREAKIVWKKKG